MGDEGGGRGQKSQKMGEVIYGRAQITNFLGTAAAAAWYYFPQALIPNLKGV